MQSGKRVTMKDIAAATGLTVNSVSRALRDCGDISAATKKLVREKAAELGYVRDVLAESLRSGSTRTVAVILGDIANPVFGLQVRSIERAVRADGYSVIIYNTDENPQREREAILNAYGKRVDGIILCPAAGTSENVRLLSDIGIPFVLMGRYFPDFPADAVLADEVKAGELAARYHLERGHSRILYFGGIAQSSCAADRVRGYRNAHAAAGIPVDEALICFTGSMNESCASEIGAVLERDVPFTAAVIFSDLVAYEVLYEFGRRGLSVPVVAFDNIRGKIKYPCVFPSIGNREEQGARAAELLLRKLRREVQSPAVLTLDVFLADGEN